MAQTTAGVFRCPSCKEFISVDAEACRFCGVAVNAEEAINLSRGQGNQDNAISGARTIKYMFLPFLILIPVTSIVLSPAWPVVLTAVIEVMCARWLIGFRDVRTPEVARLRGHVWGIALLMFVALVLVMFGLLGLLLMTRR